MPTSFNMTFDDIAELYDAVRPSYPAELIDAIAANLPHANRRILEIGSGTGQATLPLARLGHSILTLEPGARLAAIAAANLKEFPAVTVVKSTFEDWPLEPASFDLIVSATAFHWVQPEIRYRKSARALKDNGSLALFWNVPADVDNALSHEIQQVYDRHMHGKRGASSRPTVSERMQTWVDEIDRSNLFGKVAALQFPWSEWLPTERYLQLLDTYSDHATLPAPNKRRLYDGIAEILSRNHGGMQKEYVATLYMARKK